VPEHGAALRGDKYQFSGLREIPSPSIALAPAAIKVIGPNLPKQTGPVLVNDPVSMLAMSHVLAGMLKTNPFTEEYNPSAYLADVPQTPYVAENQNFVMIKEKNNYFFKQKSEDSWQAYIPEQ
ncbi:MAG: cellulose biosynthesis protein BcsG, partial [Macromonas sp.]